MTIRVSLLLLLVISLVGCGAAEEESITIRPVRTMTVGAVSDDSERAYNGRAQTERVVSLSFRSTGIITEFNIKLGQQVKKGEVLAELDNVAARLAYEQAVSALNSAKSDRNTKQLNLERVRSLYEKGGVSLSDYEVAKNGFRNAEATYLSALRSVEIQQEQIRYGKIIAPEAGVIAAVNREIDENVAAGETVAILNAGTDMEIQVGLPESLINQVQQSNTPTITFAALPGEVFAGEITEVSPAIDRNTATYPVRVRLIGATEQVKSGMAATVNFDFATASADSKSIRVPAAAVGEDAEGQFVFMADPLPNGNAVVRKQTIEIGALVKDTFEVRSGLIKGDRIITAGVHSVQDGQKVSIL